MAKTVTYKPSEVTITIDGKAVGPYVDTSSNPTQAYAERVTAALEKEKSVTAFKVLTSSDGEIVRVRYQGPARQADLYSALNFDASLGRPRGVSLMLYKIGGTL